MGNETIQGKVGEPLDLVTSTRDGRTVVAASFDEHMKIFLMLR